MNNETKIGSDSPDPVSIPPLKTSTLALDYQPAVSKSSKGRTFLRMILSALLCGLALLFLLGYFFGDVDDYGWLIFGGGVLAGGIAGYMTRGRGLLMPHWVVISMSIFFYSIGGLIVTFAGACMVTGTDVLTGKCLDELDGLIPVICLISSLVPFGLGWLIYLMEARRQPR